MDLRKKKNALIKAPDYLPLRQEEIIAVLKLNKDAARRARKIIHALLESGEIARIKKDRLCLSDDALPIVEEKRTEVDGLTINTNDTLNFNYTPKATYVSRACGYIRTYTDLSIDSTSNWISGVIVNTPEINSNNEEHVAILH